MQFLANLLTDQPVPWHPALRVVALDAAFIQMCSQSIEPIGHFHDVVFNDYGKYGLSVDVICIEKNANGEVQWDLPPHIFPICIFEPANFVTLREDCDFPDGLDQFDFVGTREELIEHLADHDFALGHARYMLKRHGHERPFIWLCDLINSTDVFGASRGVGIALSALEKQG